jgi:hypothetical protein
MSGALAEASGGQRGLSCQLLIYEDLLGVGRGLAVLAMWLLSTSHWGIGRHRIRARRGVADKAPINPDGAILPCLDPHLPKRMGPDDRAGDRGAHRVAPRA